MATKRDVIVIGASAGGVEAVRTLLAGLPADVDAAVAITLHRSPTFFLSELPEVLGRASPLKVREPVHGEPFLPGRVYLAPQDVHMTIARGRLELDRGPKQHHSRPAIDPLFESAGECYGKRVIGIILTGNLSDGVTGLVRIKEEGGLSLVQDPSEAPYPSM